MNQIELKEHFVKFIFQTSEMTVLIVQELAPTAHSCRRGECLDIQSIY